MSSPDDHLVQLIYASRATVAFGAEELRALIETSRRRNGELGITGMLLHVDGSFFQILEGQRVAVEGLFERIAADPRHEGVTTIIFEAIARRSFGEWTMGFSGASAEELAAIPGLNDFFAKGSCLEDLDRGRARKLLQAFQAGRWRLTLDAREALRPVSGSSRGLPQSRGPREKSEISCAFQPIVNLRTRRIVSYEALVRGPSGEPAGWVFERTPERDLLHLDDACRWVAVRWATDLGLECRLNLNCLPRAIQADPDRLNELFAYAEGRGLRRDRIVLEVTEGEMIEDEASFCRTLDAFRRDGVKVAIDDFGAGYSGLNLLASFQPDTIKLDMHLVRDIARQGPRQAIVRGVLLACRDLGIEVLAEGIETPEEARWCEDEGIELFQGYLFAAPGFECLPTVGLPETAGVERGGKPLGTPS